MRLNEIAPSNQIILDLSDIEITFNEDYDSIKRSFVSLQQGIEINIDPRLTKKLISKIRDDINAFSNDIDRLSKSDNYDLTDLDLLHQINQAKSLLTHLLELAR